MTWPKILIWYSSYDLILKYPVFDEQVYITGCRLQAENSVPRDECTQFDVGATRLRCWSDATSMLGQRNLGWGDVPWGCKGRATQPTFVYHIWVIYHLLRVEVHKHAKKELGQYPAILTEQTLLIKDLLYGLYLPFFYESLAWDFYPRRALIFKEVTGIFEDAQRFLR